MKAVAYCRYSSDNQREESIDAQIRAIKDYCSKENIDLIKIYTDEAKSGTNDNREEFIQMIHDCELGKFKAVIVHKLDRFARNRYDSAFYKKKLKENGVRLISVLEHLDDSPESIILESVLEGMAEYYSKNLAREVMKGMKETALECRHNGGIPPLGYDVDVKTKKYIINEGESVAVKKIFSLYLYGYGYTAIANKLNDYGFKTKSGRMFTKNSIRDILLNEKYSGVYVFNKRAHGKKNHVYKDEDKIIKIDGGIPAIISKEIFVKANQKLRSNSKGPRKVNTKVYYLLTGKIICGQCNSTYTGAGYRGGRNCKKYYIYQCINKKNKFCSNKDIRKGLLEGFVIQNLKDNVLNDECIEKLSSEIFDYINKSKKEYKDELIYLNDKKKSIANKIDTAMDLLLDGVITKQVVNKKISMLQNELNTYIDRIEQLDRKSKEHVNKNKIKSFLIFSKNNLNNGNDDMKRKIIEIFVDKIIIWNHKIDITLKISPLKQFVESGKFGGGEGSRTPVRKQKRLSISECSPYFNIPSFRRLRTGF